MISCGITKVIPKETVILSSRAPIGYVGLTQSISWHSQGIKGFINKKPNLINNYYFYFWCLKNTQLFINKATGTIFLEISSSTIKTIEVNLPPLATQQQIIDLIAPLEVLQEKVKKIIEQLNNITCSINKISHSQTLINENCSYIKGKNLKFDQNGSTLFLNISAANHKPNKFCNEPPNVFVGDVVLSLDMNTGLVNNDLEGFNGYLYKVQSATIDNWQIYYSLKHFENQRIIKEYETGTTIKHSTKSKEYLKLFTYNDPLMMQNLFKLEINLKKQWKQLDQQINRMVNLLLHNPSLKIKNDYDVNNELEPILFM